MKKINGAQPVVFPTSWQVFSPLQGHLLGHVLEAVSPLLVTDQKDSTK